MGKNKEKLEKDINVPYKEPIKIDGIQFNKFGDFYVDYDFNSKFQSISSSSKEYKILKSLIEQLARKTQEYEQKEKELKELKRQYKLSCLDCEYKNTKTDADRYRKALEEIKKVIIPLANKNPIDNCWALLNRCDECASKKDCKTQSPYFRAKQILDIINKAKGNN